MAEGSAKPRISRRGQLRISALLVSVAVLAYSDYELFLRPYRWLSIVKPPPNATVNDHHEEGPEKVSLPAGLSLIAVLLGAIYYLLGGKAVAVPVMQQAEKVPSVPQDLSHRPCARWNMGSCKARGERCKFGHFCSTCGEEHRAVECPKQEGQPAGEAAAAEN
mmetsp:Transcript_126577/g.289470  ORF Transcript_126577/g.289470 Transcript_126577/m.289470 type:complete len:163 (+) Transcript_126577:34-522(+)